MKLLCDGIFGEDHFICNFIWKSRQNKDNRNISGVSIDHEYIICYCKTIGMRSFIGAERKTDNYGNPDNDPRGPWTSANMAGLASESLILSDGGHPLPAYGTSRIGCLLDVWHNAYYM